MNYQQLIKLRQLIVEGYDKETIEKDTFFSLLEIIDPCVAMLEDF